MNALRALDVNFITGGNSGKQTLPIKPSQLLAALAQSSELAPASVPHSPFSGTPRICHPCPGGRQGSRSNRTTCVSVLLHGSCLASTPIPCASGCIDREETIAARLFLPRTRSRYRKRSRAQPSISRETSSRFKWSTAQLARHIPTCRAGLDQGIGNPQSVISRSKDEPHWIHRKYNPSCNFWENEFLPPRA